MTTFHNDLFRSVVIYFIVMAVWGLALAALKRGPTGSYLGALVLGECLIVVQALSGLLLVATGHHPEDGLHWLYGFVLISAIPVVYGSWAQKRNDRVATLLYGVACALIVVIAVVRASKTG